MTWRGLCPAPWTRRRRRAGRTRRCSTGWPPPAWPRPTATPRPSPSPPSSAPPVATPSPSASLSENKTIYTNKLLTLSSSQTGPLSLVEISRDTLLWLDHLVAIPVLLCHKDTAQDTQSPQLGIFLAFRSYDLTLLYMSRFSLCMPRVYLSIIYCDCWLLLLD